MLRRLMQAQRRSRLLRRLSVPLVVVCLSFLVLFALGYVGATGYVAPPAAGEGSPSPASPPLVPLDTGASEGGKPGIKVGNEFYAARTNFLSYTYGWWQVVVLDRATLGLVSNTTYSCYFPGGCEADELRKDLSKLDNTKLVIAATHPIEKPIYSEVSVFKPIGAPDLKGQLFAPGKVSVIGVPGLPPGQADIRAIADGEAGSGAMNGYLTPDQFFNYTWLPKERLQFDTRAPGEGRQADIKVGGESFEWRGRNEGGFHVEVFDPHTLAHRDGETFLTNCEACPQDASPLAVLHMADFLEKQVRKNDLVVISSHSGKPAALDLNGVVSPARLSRLAAAVASVGGTKHLFNTSGRTPGSPYSLIGWGGAGEGNGEETSPQKDPKPGDGRLRGALTPDHQSLFKPTAVSAVDEPPEALAQLLLKPPTPWPLDGDSGAQKAIAYIGSQDSRLGANPRTAYWTQPFDQATWDQIAGDVKGLTYPGEGHDFTEKEFNDARDELVKEIAWVGRVRSYLKTLSSPFADNGLSSWANLTTIADKVKAALNPPDQRGAMLVLDIVGGVLSIGGVAGGPAVELISVTYEVGLQYLTQDRGGGDLDEVSGNANELAAGMVSHLQEAQASFRNMGNIIVSDYDKLKTVGTLGGCSPSATGCSEEWQFSQRDQQQAAAATYRSIEGAFDQELMSLTFKAYLLGPRVVHHNSNRGVTTNARDYPCGANDYYPFRDEPDNGQVALLQEPPNLYDVLALGNLSTLSVTNYIPAVPPKPILDRMFGPVSSSLDPKAGGLGIYAPDFLRSDIGPDYDRVQKPGLLQFPCGAGRDAAWGPFHCQGQRCPARSDQSGSLKRASSWRPAHRGQHHPEGGEAQASRSVMCPARCPGAGERSGPEAPNRLSPRRPRSR
jgi:hypothetical protein